MVIELDRNGLIMRLLMVCMGEQSNATTSNKAEAQPRRPNTLTSVSSSLITRRTLLTFQQRFESLLMGFCLKPCV